MHFGNSCPRIAALPHQLTRIIKMLLIVVVVVLVVTLIIKAIVRVVLFRVYTLTMITVMYLNRQKVIRRIVIIS